MGEKIRGFIDKYFHWFVTLPATIVVMLTVFFPAAYGIYTSFFVKNLLRGRNYFAGLENYRKIFTNPDFWFSIRQTVIYAGGATAIAFVISLFLSVSLRRGLRFRPFILTAILFPWIVPMVAGAVAWRWVLHSVYGVLNYILMTFGVLAEPYFWLGKPVSSMGWLLIVEAWYEIPLLTLIIYAGTQRISDQLYEVADLDGANAFQRFIHVTLPLIKPEMLMSLIICSMFSFRRFGFPFLLTGGGPGKQTEIVGLTIYNYANKFLRMGYASAISVIVLIIIIVFVAFYFKLFQNEEGEVGIKL